MSYRVDLDIYNGPLDLLLYLIRKEEVEITDIPVERITDQYLAYLDLLESLDINIAGDFLVMAATLMEIKSRMILPRPDLEAEEIDTEDEGDPRLELVQQLLEYKRFKEAADGLADLGDEQRRRHGRPPTEIVAGPEEQRDALDTMMKDVSLWDLLNAFARLMRSINIAPREVVYDETPVEELAGRILDVMSERRSARFSDIVRGLFADRDEVGRSSLIGAFLAILECIRQRRLVIEQDDEFGDLRMVYRDELDALEGRNERAAPPEAQVTSRREARDRAGVESPHGRLDTEELTTEEVHKTEFDEDLDAIDVPDVRLHRPTRATDEGTSETEADDGESDPSAEAAPAHDQPAEADAAHDSPGDEPAEAADDAEPHQAGDEPGERNEPAADKPGNDARPQD